MEALPENKIEGLSGASLAKEVGISPCMKPPGSAGGPVKFDNSGMQ